MQIVADFLGIAPLPQHLTREAAILGIVRAPRTCLGLLVGAGLGAAGAVMQGLFRNPLADPGLIGITAGGALGAVGAIVFGAHFLGPVASGALGLWLTPVAAFTGGLLACFLIARLGRRGGITSVPTLLLAGVAIAALCGAGTGLLIFLADDRQVRDITFWTLGSLAGARWPQLLPLILTIGLPVLVLVSLARPLNALMLGEEAAWHLGVRVEAVKRSAMALAAVAASAGVAFTGPIAFVGLVVPHLVRLGFGTDHRVVVPVSALFGATLMVLADLAARSLAVPAELPIGVVTSLLGAPFFLWLLRRMPA